MILFASLCGLKHLAGFLLSLVSSPNRIFCLSCSCGKRVGSKLKFWKEKQLELESKFKEVYPSTSVVMSSKGKSKKTGKKSQNSQKAYTNFHLSLYAAHLTKELVVKVLALNLKKPIFGK